MQIHWRAQVVYNTYFKYLKKKHGIARDFLTAKKMKFSINDSFSKCDQIRSFLRISSHLLKKSLIENFFFVCSVWTQRHMQDPIKQ